MSFTYLNELYSSDLQICQMSHTAPEVRGANIIAFIGKVIR